MVLAEQCIVCTSSHVKDGFCDASFAHLLLKTRENLKNRVQNQAGILNSNVDFVE